MPMKMTLAAIALALASTCAARASAADYKWPDNIPPEAKALMEPLPLSPTGQAVPGYPNGAPAVSADTLKLSDDDIAKLKAGKFTAGLVMHTMDAGWPHLQVSGITSTLQSFGIQVVGTTDAKFNVGQQISDLEQMIARKPDVIFSIPIDPKSESEAYKKAAAAGIKLVFLDNVPVDMAPGRDYVSVVAADNEKNAFFAADELAKALGGKGEVGILTLVYDYYYSVAARKVGAQKAFAQYPDIKVDAVGTFTSPEKAYEVATSMLTANPDMKGIFVAWDTPAQQTVAAAKTLGRDIIVTTNDLAADSAVNVARGEFLAVGAQQPYDQGVAEAKVAALALLGKQVPAYVSVPTLRVKKINLLSALKQVTKEEPPASLIKLCNDKCF
ncbi:substrate-binding domain-containing protein [Rhizobium sp. BK376]|uniref:substrate-binding domain-containing protein n=1 Tax=Rhizobium sp. BK376 TaxID=2512149 RepID=UPI00104647B7|nr:substrate-binding domain-containing protein [Rhizobium sp. BK376]TCR69233.1 monosaccharide ABC transporter substrate-binding protein (CUT2 family) [Rhizobium sp. BK376]